MSQNQGRIDEKASEREKSISVSKLAKKKRKTFTMIRNFFRRVLVYTLNGE